MSGYWTGRYGKPGPVIVVETPEAEEEIRRSYPAESIKFVREHRSGLGDLGVAPASFMPDSLKKALAKFVFGRIDEDLADFVKKLSSGAQPTRAQYMDVAKIYMDVTRQAVAKHEPQKLPAIDWLVAKEWEEVRKNHVPVSSAHFILKGWIKAHPEQAKPLDDEMEDLESLKKDMDARWGIVHPDPSLVKSILEYAIRDVWSRHGGIFKKGEISVGEISSFVKEVERLFTEEADQYKRRYISMLLVNSTIGALILAAVPVASYFARRQ